MDKREGRISTDDVVRNFRDFLTSSWPWLTALSALSFKSGLDLDDWLQANWEILVEAALCATPVEFLSVYGDGADCNGASSRVWMPDAPPTHEIHCAARLRDTARNELDDDLITPKEWEFSKFVSFNNSQYDQSPPFDHVLLEKGERLAVVRLDDVLFQLRHLP